MVKPETGQANFAEKVVRSPVVGVLGEHQAIGQAQRRLEAFGQPLRRGRARTTTRSTTDVDLVLELLVQRRRRVDLVELAVDLDPLEAALLQVGELLAVLALAAAHDGGEQISSRVPSGSARMRSTIWLTVWLSIGRPVAGE